MLLLAIVLALAAPASADDAWRWPVRGEVLTPFRLAASPFAAGQHRGIDIAATAGAPVRSTCAGRVDFAGRLPARGGVVTVLCGPLVATYLELGKVAVRRGTRVAAGAPIGTVAASHLQLGARRAGERHGYVDPLALLDGEGPPPLGGTPARARPPREAPPRGAPPAAAPARRPSPAPAKRPARAPADRRHGIPRLAWLGLALLAAGTPLGALVPRRRRRRLHASRVRV